MPGVDAIVLGGGVGGLAAAALLAHEGLRVEVVEKNVRVGGACAAEDLNGCRVDLGTHIFTRGGKGPLGEVLRRVGDERRLEFVTRDPLIETYVLGQRFRIRRSRADLARFFCSLARRLGVPLSDSVRAARAAARAAVLSDDACAALDEVSLEAYVARITRHPALELWIGYLMTTFFVVPPREASAGESLWCLQQILRDFAIGYPKGGSAAIPGAYRAAAEARGARVRTGVPARRIVLEEGVARGVELSDGTRIGSRIVVSALPLRATAGLLEAGPAAFLDRARSAKGSHYGVQLKIGLARPLVRAGFLMGLVPTPRYAGTIAPGTLDRIFDAVQAGRLPPIHMLTAVAQTNFDPSLAPEGTQLLSAAILAPNGATPLADPPEAWERELRAAVDHMVPGWRSAALWTKAVSVGEIEAWAGRPGGGLISTAQSVDQIGRGRSGPRTPVRGLYLAGDGVGRRGVGTELAALSAIEAADAIARDRREGAC